MSASADDITQLLLDWQEGDGAALQALIPKVEEVLRVQARAHLRRERADHTLQPTALVNEAYLRLIRQQQVRWQGRAHFFAIASTSMRRILLDHARKAASAKRGGGFIRVVADDSDGAVYERDLDLLALDQALLRLAEIAPRQARTVELRFFGGLTLEETSEVLDISVSSVKIDWQMAKAWLFKELRESPPQEQRPE